MRIAILSLNPGHNYGGILQSYALKTVLERMGHQVMVICRPRLLPPRFSFMKMPNYGVRILRNLLGRGDGRVLIEYDDAINRQTIFRHMTVFCQKYLDLRPIQDFGEISPDEFDAYFVGSDQVWRPRYFHEQFQTGIENAFLFFTKSWNVKRVAYGPSFGVDEWEYTDEQSFTCAGLLSGFDAVSVREESGLRLCEKYLLRNDVVQVCDPTMLLSREDYENLIKEDTPVSKGNLLVYCLDKSEELDKLVSRIAQEQNLTPFSTNGVSGNEYTIEQRVKPSVESWIRAFQDAEFVITDSFHACVFSLIFHKPFLVFGNAQRGMSRFETLLDTFGQRRRLLYKADEYNGKDTYPSIDNVDETLLRLREASNDFLKRAL